MNDSPDSTTQAPATDAPAPDASTPIAAPTAAHQATSELVSHIEAAGKTELEALKPLIGKICRQFVSQYEAKLSGITGIIERRVIDSIMDAIFGPAPQ